MTTLLNNSFPRKPQDSVDLLPYTISAVWSLVNRLNPIVKSFQRRKQGNVSADTAWAKARLNWITQLAIRFGLYTDDNEYYQMIDDHFESMKTY